MKDGFCWEDGPRHDILKKRGFLANLLCGTPQKTPTKERPGRLTKKMIAQRPTSSSGLQENRKGGADL